MRLYNYLNESAEKKLFDFIFVDKKITIKEFIKQVKEKFNVSVKIEKSHSWKGGAKGKTIKISSPHDFKLIKDLKALDLPSFLEIFFHELVHTFQPIKFKYYSRKAITKPKEDGTMKDFASDLIDDLDKFTYYLQPLERPAFVMTVSFDMIKHNITISEYTELVKTIKTHKFSNGLDDLFEIEDELAKFTSDSVIKSMLSIYALLTFLKKTKKLNGIKDIVKDDVLLKKYESLIDDTDKYFKQFNVFNKSLNKHGKKILAYYKTLKLNESNDVKYQSIKELTKLLTKDLAKCKLEPVNVPWEEDIDLDGDDYLFIKDEDPHDVKLRLTEFDWRTTYNSQVAWILTKKWYTIKIIKHKYNNNTLIEMSERCYNNIEVV